MYFVKRLILIVIWAPVSIQFANAELVEVVTDSGIYRGYSSEYAEGISVYKGIGYAAPPVGDLRWKPPEPAIPFAGIRQADRIGSACWQEQNSDASLKCN